MDFNEYQKKAKTTLVNNHNTKELLIARLALGLSGEAGEIAEKVKKYLRGDYSYITALRMRIKGELGDVLWYVAVLASQLEFDLDDIVKENITKLASRKKQNKIRGNGDCR